ncbi:hypothetical protein OPV22_013291 [Ensete ventricosum]|uniref:Uncharacterized protein n=1 Tax=Ensete ventricosum TaxID=4639 RepID=A0AAV8R535_ENSVE|nr:hypothetical protein OPV22_013291 [Ensete ventricosum]
MFPRSSNDSLQIKQGDEFYCRLLSKESSEANPSFRVYYGVASGAVPFMWESQPGTPKHNSSAAAAALPPLTPPPSYYYSTRNSISVKASKSNFLRTILSKLILRKIHTSPPSALFSTSVSSSSSSAFGCSDRRRNSSSPPSYFASEEFDDGSPASSTLCFGIPRSA